MASTTLNGLANLRGKVLPIISLRRLFGFAEQAPDDATRAVIINVGQPLGFVVDRVASVVGVEGSEFTVDLPLLEVLPESAPVGRPALTARRRSLKRTRPRPQANSRLAPSRHPARKKPGAPGN